MPGKESDMNNRKIFTSESVTQGHPDKLCDLVSDSVLDAVLEQDPMGRVACETAATTGMVLVMGEITTSARIDIAQIARKAICDAGYDRPEMGFDGHSCNVMVAMGRQSPDIAMGVDNAYDDGTTGAGDQGMMFGFACTQTKELMPAPIAYAHNLTKALTHARESGLLPWLRPDGKSQVSVEYGPDGLPARIDTVVVSTQHADSIAIDDLRKAVIETVIEPNLPSRLLDENTKYYVNPTGRFVIGGPAGDSGLTGRKIIVDTYGGYAAHGGGAFSGKDPTKVDRSGAYMARYIAKIWSRPVWPTPASCSWPTPSAWRTPFPCSLRHMEPARSRMISWPSLCANASTCARRPSSRRSICAARSTVRPPVTATLAARNWICRGKRRIWCRLCLQKRKK